MPAGLPSRSWQKFQIALSDTQDGAQWVIYGSKVREIDAQRCPITEKITDRAFSVMFSKNENSKSVMRKSVMLGYGKRKKIDS